MDRSTTLRDPVDISPSDQNMKEEEMEVKVDADELCALRSAKTSEVIHGVVYYGIKHYEDLLAAKDEEIAVKKIQITNLKKLITTQDEQIAELRERVHIGVSVRDLRRASVLMDDLLDQAERLVR